MKRNRCAIWLGLGFHGPVYVPVKCGWFGHESSRPYERPRCCRFGVSEIPRMEDGKATSK